MVLAAVVKRFVVGEALDDEDSESVCQSQIDRDDAQDRAEPRREQLRSSDAGKRQRVDGVNALRHEDLVRGERRASVRHGLSARVDTEAEGAER